MNPDAPIMKPDPQREAALFQAAAQLTGGARASFLDSACHGNPDLRQRLEALLAAHEQSQGVLQETEPAVKATMKVEFGDEAKDEAIGRKIGRYKILEKVGEGGCGVVYVAEQTEPVRRRVALKVIKLGMDTKQVVARFEAERQALAMMDHPNIAKVLDAGTTEGRARHSVRAGAEQSEIGAQGTDAPYLSAGRPYFVMELVRGIKITDYCDQNNLSTKERLDLFIKVCQAIQHAHQKGIIHRDIKPSNILVTLHDGVPVPKVIDFGIAKATEGRLTDATVYTQLHQFIGTPAYMSPEQAEMSGLDIDTRSDIYSLGVLLYELLTGKTPFDAQELMSQGLDAMRKTIREEDPVRPSTKLATMQGEELTATAKHRSADTSKLMHQLKGDLDWIAMKCLEKDRTRRYETANGLAMDLKRHLNNEPVNARPPSQLYRFQKLVRRNKVAFAGAAAVGVTLVLGVLVSTGLAIRATRAEHEQSLLRQQAQASESLAQHNLARQYLRRGQSLCAEGKVAPGLHWMARAHEQSPATSVALRETIRENLAAWAERWLPPRAVVLHDSGVHATALSPDGRRLVTGNHNGQVQFWSADTGEQLPTAFNHEENVWVIRFSPDGTRVFTSSQDRTLRFSDARTGQALGPPIKQSGVVFQAAFSPDGSRVATGADDGTFTLWNAEDGTPVRAQPIPGSAITSVMFSPDGRRILTGSSDQTARLWDGATGEPAGAPLRHPRPVRFVGFSPRGERFVTVCADNTVRLWRTADGEPQGLPMTHYDASEAAFSPDGERLLTWGGDRTARLWLLQTGAQWGNDMTHEEVINSATFSAAGTEVLSIGGEGRAQVWSVRTTEPLGPPSQQELPAQATATANGWSVVGFGSHAVSLRFVAAASRSGLRRALLTNGCAVAFTSDGRRLLVGDRQGTIQWWSPETGEVVPWKIGHERGIYFLTISADGRRALTAGDDNTARLWSLEGEEQLLQIFRHERPVRAAAFSPDGRLVATASFDRTARLWSAETGQPLGPPIQHPNMVEDVAFNPAGDRLATACGDGAARLWSVPTGQQVGPVMAHRGAVLGLKFSPDGKQLLSGSRDHTARFWNVATGLPTGMVLEHPGWVEDFCFTRDGRRLATVSDGKLQLWSAEAGELLGPPLEFVGGAWQVVLGSDDRHIAASAVTHTVGAWTLPPTLQTDLRQIAPWVQVLTWQEMDDNGVLTWLDRAAWQARRAQLDTLGTTSRP